jgi:hypothetical protein
MHDGDLARSAKAGEAGLSQSENASPSDTATVAHSSSVMV